MLVLHALWQESRHLVLFAESSALYREKQGVRGPAGTVHPFMLSAEELRALIASAEIDDADLDECLLDMPVSDEGALPSEYLAPNAKEETLPQGLATCRVPCLRLDLSWAPTFLLALPELTKSEPSLRLGGSALFWHELLKFLLESLSHGRFVPTLGRSENSFSSAWLPVHRNEEERKRFALFAASLPPLCRRSFGKTVVSAEAVVQHFVAAVGDSIIRGFLTRTPLTPEVDSQMQRRHELPLRWLQSLTRPDAEVSGPFAELLNFEQRLRQWAQPVLPATPQHTLRTALEFCSPESSSGGWQLRFSIESKETSERVNVASLWSGQLGFLQESSYSLQELEATVLRDLARLSQIFPPLRRALLDPFPVALELDTQEAYEFLRNTTQLLKEADIGLSLPSWWGQQRPPVGLRLHVNASPSTASSQQSALSMQSLMDFSWSVAVGDTTLSLEEFKKLADQKIPLVLVNDQWVELNPQHIEQTLKYLKRFEKTSALTAFDAFRLGLGLEQDADIIPILEFSGTGWVERLLNAGGAGIPALAQPREFAGELRPYQLQGLSWLGFLSSLNVGGCLADDMGLGKTVQFLALLLHELQSGLWRGPNLLVVPMSILNNWVEEANRFAPELSMYLHHGSERLSGSAFRDTASSVHLVVTTYSLLHRDERSFAQIPWSRITLDEAQNIKNLQTKQTQAVRRLVRTVAEIGTNGPCHRLALTGTPLENNLEELWSIFDFLNPGLLGTLPYFRQKFSIPIERYRDREQGDVLARAIRPFVMRRLKSDPHIAQDLPEKIEIDVFASMTPEQAKLYQQTLDAMLLHVDDTSGIHRKGLVLATITKLKQICDHPALVLRDGKPLGTRSGKVNALVELLEIILAEGDRALIFTQYAQFGHLLKPFLEERFAREVLFLHGSLPRRARDQVIQRFQQDDGPALFLLSLKAGGFGLNLTQANQVVHLDQWWNPAVLQQATDRAHRIGQERTVQVRRFLCKGTLEERIAKLLEQKKNLADQVVSATKNLITEMSADELRNFLSLSSVSIDEEEQDYGLPFA